jgi:hypothetical protein
LKLTENWRGYFLQSRLADQVLELADVHINVEKLKVRLLDIGQGLFQMQKVQRPGFFISETHLTRIRYKVFGFFL